MLNTLKAAFCFLLPSKNKVTDRAGASRYPRTGSNGAPCRPLGTSTQSLGLFSFMPTLSTDLRILPLFEYEQ